MFCGSSQGKKSSYQDAAIELGKELVFNGSFLFIMVSMGFFFYYFWAFYACVLRNVGFFLMGFVEILFLTSSFLYMIWIS